MNKQEFLGALKKKLSDFPRKDVEERLTFYGEMIDDRMEEGCTEEEAVAQIGSLDGVASQIIADGFSMKMEKGERKLKRPTKTWEIVLLAVGSPLWIALAIACIAVLLSLYVSLWSVVLSCWASFVGLLAGGAGLAIVGAAYLVAGNAFTGIAYISIAVFCVGLSIFFYYGGKMLTKWVVLFTKKVLTLRKKSMKGEK